MPDQPTPDRIRIAFVITELHVGGAERCLARLVTGINRARFDPYVFSLWQRPAPGEDALVQAIEGAGVPVHFLNAQSVSRAWKSRNALKRAFQELQVDIVQNFLFRANVLGTSAAQSAGVAATLLGVRVADPSRWRMLLERRAAGQAARVACVSDSVAEFVKTHWACGSEKLAVIPNCVDTRGYPCEPADLSALGIAPGRRVLIAIGRLHRQKGFDWLLQLAPQLLRALPGHDLLIVGDGEERNALTQQANSTPLRGRIHFAGRRSDVPALLSASDALLLPSRWEGMPNVLLEAMASKLPVLATRVQGVEQVLGEGAADQTVAFGDGAGFIEAAPRVIFNRTELGKRNRQRVEAHFSLATMVERYQTLYETLVVS